MIAVFSILIDGQMDKRTETKRRDVPSGPCGLEFAKKQKSQVNMNLEDGGNVIICCLDQLSLFPQKVSYVLNYHCTYGKINFILI